MIEKLAIFGTSGFAYETADVALAMGVSEIVLISSEKTEEQGDNGFHIFPESEVNSLKAQGYQFSIGVGNGAVRENLSHEYHNFPFPNLIHPSAHFGFGQREIMEHNRGNIVTAGVIFTCKIQLGDFGLYNLNTTVGHDCIIEDFVSIMPGVNISGNVHVKKGAFIGTGATVLQGKENARIEIGENAIVGASSLVTKHVDAGTTVVGAPAKMLKR